MTTSFKPAIDDLRFIDHLLSKSIQKLNNPKGNDLVEPERLTSLDWLTAARRDIRNQINDSECEDLVSLEIQ